MKISAFTLALLGSLGCATPPPVARVAAGVAAADRSMSPILSLPTLCMSDDSNAASCTPSAYVSHGEGTVARALPQSFAELIDPLLRLKLELAGFTLADAEALRLEPAERTERATTTQRAGTTATTQETEQGRPPHIPMALFEPKVPTVANLPQIEQRAVASSIGMRGVASSILTIRRTSGRLTFSLAWELRTLPEGTLALRVHCTEDYEFPEETASILASCIGNGVLAVRAPDALVERAP